MCEIYNDNCICSNCPTECKIFKVEDLKLVNLISKYLNENLCRLLDDEFCNDCGVCYESEEESFYYDNWLFKK